jgi:ribosomal protein L37AE/L43A
MQLDAQTVKKAHTCPKCKNSEIDRIPRNPLLKTVAPWLAVKHYICYKCGNKFYSRK